MNQLNLPLRFRVDHSQLPKKFMTLASENGSDILLDKSDCWSNAEWEEEHPEAAVCPVCKAKHPLKDIFGHLIQLHSLDLQEIKRMKKLDFFGFIKLVNYTRAQNFGPSLANIQVSILESFDEWFNNETYLIPQLQDDPLLYSIEDGDDSEEIGISDDDEECSSFVEVSQESLGSETNQLQEIIRNLTEKLHISQANNKKSQDSYESYKEMVEKTFMSKSIESAREEMEESRKGQTTFLHSREDEGNYYFESYAGSEIHESMLRDTIRTNGYRDFIYNNKGYFKGKTVLDVGCGTGILSMFAAKAGAFKVISIDNSAIIEKAKLIAKENKLDHIITFVRGKVEDVELPVDKVDIIISEWMGYFLLFEGMLDSVLYARDKWLSPSGVMAPSRTDILLSAFGDDEWYNDKVHFWNDVYGFSMNAMSSDIKMNGLVAVIPSTGMISNSVTIQAIDTKIATVKELDFVSPFRLEISRDGKVYGICGWFDTFFTGEGIDQVSFSTSPFTTPTHWMQTLFLLQSPIPVFGGDTLSGIFACSKSTTNPRELAVKIDWNLDSKDGITSGSQSFTVV